VVVAQFKQRFNAFSMRERLADGAYSTAFVVETSEPYYYVVAASYADVTEADRALSEIKQAGDIVLRQPCPFILDAAIARKR
ncbi:MAG: SPOR domain-containing protein, partial [Muribaculaceae bacterium]|nr:SPOR domain-containing protein [Muribaculaceae bacterium]